MTGAAPCVVCSLMSVVLIGYRGCGKSTVGRLIADRAALPLVDTDQLIVDAAGMPIREIFASKGEPLFRDLETKALRKAVAVSGAVISTGGGIVIRPENRRLLQEAGRYVVYLHAKAKTLHARIEGDLNSQHSRPNLTALGGGLAEVEHLLEVRDPLYREVARLVIEVEGRTPSEIAEEILRGCEPATHCG